jgi:hypothetical protein
MALNGKYLEDADQLLEAGDYSQASEKYWGAAAEVIKSIAERRGWTHSSHRDIRIALRRVAEETGDSELRRLFSIMESLHANFYENWMDGEDLRIHAEDAHRLIDKLAPLAA